MSVVAGDQTFKVCPSPVDVPPGLPDALRLALAGANPGRGDRLVFAVGLPDDRVATLELFDVAGRVVRRRAVDSGAGTVDLSAGARLVPGIYWARLTHESGELVRRICIAQ